MEIDFRPEEDYEYDKFDYLWAAAAYAGAAKWVRNMQAAAIERGLKPRGEQWRKLNGVFAMTKIAVAYDAQQSESHPRNNLSTMATRGVVHLRVDGASQKIGNDRIELVNTSGVLTKSDEEGVRAWVSDAVSYGATDVSSKTPGSMTANIREKDLKVLAMRPDAYEMTNVPAQFTKDPVVNANQLYLMYSSTTNNAGMGLPYMMKHQAQIAQGWEESTPLAFSGKVPAVISKYVKDGKMKMPSVATQPNLGAQNEKVFYAVVKKHREIRGEDKKGLSPMTSGYYLTSTTRAMDSAIWKIADILSVLYDMEATHFIVRREKLPFYVITAIALAGFEVVVLCDELVKVTIPRITFASEIPVFKKGKKPVFFMLDAFGSGKPVIDKKRNLTGGVELKDFKTQFDKLTGNKSPYVVMSHVFLRDYMADFSEYLMPSIHCHSGQVIFVSHPVKKRKMDVPAQFVRMSVANKYKTAFPYRRVPFVMVDPDRPKHLVSNGLLLPRTCGKEINEIEPELATFSDHEYVYSEVNSKLKDVYTTLLDACITEEERNVTRKCTQCYHVHRPDESCYQDESAVHDAYPSDEAVGAGDSGVVVEGDEEEADDLLLLQGGMAQMCATGMGASTFNKT